jgi:FkbM family methyltransferase
MKVTNALSEKGLKKIPGIKSFHKFLYKIMEPQGIIQITVNDHKMFVNTQDKVIVPSLIIYGVWEKFETDLFYKTVKPGDIVVDVGANIGYYTLIAADLVGKEGMVYAFEPEPSNYKLLTKNVEINNFRNVTLIQKAVSEEMGRIKLYLDKVNLGAPSFSEENIFIERGSYIDVKTISLDDFFENHKKEENLNFIKIDAEGAEGLIVNGARNILQQNNPKILMEFWPYGQKNIGTDPIKLLNTLMDYGYRMRLVDDKNQSLITIEVEEILKICEQTENGMGHVNLLFEK